jgi:3-oxoadipate enol-lactonase
MPDVRLVDGGTLAAETTGAGPPLLLLRPLGGSIASWTPFADALAPHVRVVMFDPRGTGCSSAAPLPTTTRRMAGDALAVLDALGVERAHVYGVSLGGMVACRLAADSPARVDGLVLASTPLSGRSDAGALRHAGEVARCLVRPPRAAASCLAACVLSDAFRAAHPGRVARIQARAGTRPASHRGLLTLMAAALMHDARRDVDRIGADTLVIAGERDTFVAPDSQRRLATRLRHGRFACVPGAGHDVSAEAPEAVARLVLAHLLPMV